MTLTDQFVGEADHELLFIDRFALPVVKNQGGIIDAVTNYTWWRLDRNLGNPVSSVAVDRMFGARPLARVIQEHIKKPLADELLFGKLAKGGLVRVKVVGGKLALSFTRPPPKPKKKAPKGKGDGGGGTAPKTPALVE